MPRLVTLAALAAISLAFTTVARADGSDGASITAMTTISSNNHPVTPPSPVAAPEPATWALLGAGLAALAIVRRTRPRP